MEGKLIIISAPSGSGKSTIIRRLIDDYGLQVHFSISATSRKPREGEVHGVDYFFLDSDSFRQKIEQGDFLEYEEVYPGLYYGTLRSQVDDTLSRGEHLILDIDVVGALNVKQEYSHRAITIFIQPPSIEELSVRLRARGTDNEERIRERLGKASKELEYAEHFDAVIVNDDLDRACADVYQVISDFIRS